jgi:hypothetical protein
VEENHQLRQIGFSEIVGAHACIETLEAEVDRVGAIFDSGFGAFPIAGRGEQFRDLCPDCGL